MENWIHNYEPPRSLILAWQASDEHNDRFRYAVGRLRSDGESYILEYFNRAEFSTLNEGRPIEHVVSMGFQGYPGLRVDRAHHDVLKSFLRRLPPTSRSDFPEYLRQFRIASSVRLTPMTLLAITEAKLPSDGFSFVDPLSQSSEECDLMLEVAGHRYYRNKLGFQLAVGDAVEIEPDPENEYDGNAVKLLARRELLGFINRLQAPTFKFWLQHRSMSAVVERLNGKEGRPRAFVFIRIRQQPRMQS